MKKNTIKFLISLIFLLAIFSIGFVFNQFSSALSLSPGIAHAGNTIHQDLTSSPDTVNGWIFTTWRLSMGLANVFVAIVLFFFAFVNVAHINYDAWQLKKILPKLIIGIILANFSMVICRMMADIATVLIHTFAQDPKAMMTGLLCSVSLTAQGMPTDAIIAVFTGPLLLFFILVLIIIFIGILVMSLLMLIRKSVISILAISAPIAFIMMAFPPTESYFKKWWDWETKWVFMGPVIIFLLFLAGKIGAEGCGSFDLNRTIAALALIYLACIVPFKLGGAVMGAVGNLSKKGTNAAWNNPWSKHQRGLAQRAINNRTPIGQIRHNFTKAQEDLAADMKMDSNRYEERRRINRANDPNRESIETEEQRRIRAELDLKQGTDVRTRAYIESEEGAAAMNSVVNDNLAAGYLERAKQQRIFEVYDGDRKTELQHYEADISNTQLKLEKIKDDGRVLYASDRLRAAGELDRVPELKTAMANMTTAENQLRSARTPEETQAAQTRLDAARAAAEPLLAQHAQTIVDEGQINRETGEIFTLAEARTFIESGNLDNYAEKRFYSIVSKRAAEDSSSDAQSYSPVRVEEEFLDANRQFKNGKYGPFKRTAADDQHFFTGEALSNGEAGHSIVSDLGQLRQQMGNVRTMGASLKSYSKVLQVGNQELLGASLKNAWDMTDQAGKARLIQTAQQHNIVGADATTLNIAELQRLATEVQLNTSGDRVHAGFANNVRSQLEEADGRQLDYTDDRGNRQAVFGRTGLGQGAWFHSKKSGDIRPTGTLTPQTQANIPITPTAPQPPQDDNNDEFPEDDEI